MFDRGYNKPTQIAYVLEQPSKPPFELAYYYQIYKNAMLQIT